MADQKLIDLTATTTPAATDLVYGVIDPGGTPLDRKAVIGNLPFILLESGQGTKISGMTADASPTLDDLITTINDPSGTPANRKVTLANLLVLLNSNYLLYEDQQAQNTNGGSFSSGAWRTRVLNTEVSDTGGYGTLASNQITLSAGTYRVRASAPAFAVNQHQIRFQNVTSAVTLAIGSNEYADSAAPGGTRSVLSGIFTIAAAQALELQHQCASTKATNGFGPLCNFTTEIYAIVELWKIG